MPSLISPSFFKLDINIPNEGIPEVDQRIQALIDEREPECLTRVLGYNLYKDFLANGEDSRMTDLLNGVDYISWSGASRNWKGLVYIQGIDKSLIAYYIYYYWEQMNSTQSTGVGTAITRSEAGITLLPFDKMRLAWRKFSEGVRELVFFLWSKNNPYVQGAKVYPELSNSDLAYTLESTRPITFI